MTLRSTLLYILLSLADFREVGLSRGDVDPSSWASASSAPVIDDDMGGETGLILVAVGMVNADEEMEEEEGDEGAALRNDFTGAPKGEAWSALLRNWRRAGLLGVSDMVGSPFAELMLLVVLFVGGVLCCS